MSAAAAQLEAQHGGEVPPGYKRTEVGVIPEDWEVTPVGQAFEICNNLRMPTKWPFGSVP